jgi:hypothetical protein
LNRRLPDVEPQNLEVNAVFCATVGFSFMIRTSSITPEKQVGRDLRASRLALHAEPGLS